MKSRKTETKKVLNRTLRKTRIMLLLSLFSVAIVCVANKLFDNFLFMAFPKNIVFVGTVEFSNEPNRGQFVPRMDVDHNDPIIQAIESWAHKKIWRISFVSYLPKKQLSSERLSIVLVGDTVVLKKRKKARGVWKQFECKSDDGIKSYFSILQKQYEKTFNEAELDVLIDAENAKFEE